ncbi:MAG: hypothetical protein ABIN58_10815 [candidate division WOR-3 bacterium]
MVKRKRRRKKKRSTAAKPIYQMIRKPMPPPTQVHESKLRPRRRQKKVDLREIVTEEMPGEPGD